MGEVNGLKILCLQRDNARLQMELDGTCNAEELRQEREARQKAEAELAELWSRFDKQMLAEAEVERLTGRMKEAEDLIKGLHAGWKKARKAHLETCKNAQSEIDKLHTENVCLQEIVQEFSSLLKMTNTSTKPIEPQENDK